jgi:hypothetical protein
MTTLSLLIAIATAALVLWLAFEVLRLRRRVDLVPQEGGVYEALRLLDQDLSKLEATVADLGPRVESEQLVPLALQHTAVVSYDAYGDVAGSLSRSIALLDAGGSGIVVSLLVGREQTRWYTKEVSHGTGSEPLSPEEQRAVANALSGTMRA